MNVQVLRVACGSLSGYHNPALPWEQREMRTLTLVFRMTSLLSTVGLFAACGRTPLDGSEGCHTNADCSTGEHCDATTQSCEVNTEPACGVAQACSGGSCPVTEGAFEPTESPTYLSPGQHVFTSILIAAGITVYVKGDGNASGTLELFSQGPIVVDGTIDLSGGPGTEGSSGGDGTATGIAGAGGFTGEPYQSGAPSTACSYIAGNPGLLGTGISGSAGTCSVIPSTTCSYYYTVPFTAPIAQFGGGAGVHTGYRAYGSGGGGPAGGAPGALCPPYVASIGIEDDCSGVAGGGGALNGNGGQAGHAFYDGIAGTLGQTQCPGDYEGVPQSCVGGGGGGSIGVNAANDLGVFNTFQTGSGGGGGSADYLNRPSRSGTSGGGGGGGALRLATNSSLTINGQLLVNGGQGADAFYGTDMNSGCDPQPGAAGGGGSGGVIYLSAPNIAVGKAAVISAVGGDGGRASPYATGGSGGTGGTGRIRLSVNPSFCSLAGYFNPPLAAGCAEANQVGSAYVGACS